MPVRKSTMAMSCTFSLGTPMAGNRFGPQSIAVMTNTKNSIAPKPYSGTPSGGKNDDVNGMWKRTCCMGDIARREGRVYLWL